LVTKTIAGVTGAWYEIDLTGYLQQQKSVGATVVTLLLRNTVARRPGRTNPRAYESQTTAPHRAAV
jgi:hypothetical protein